MRKVDLNTASKFLKTLAQGAVIEHTFQTFADNKSLKQWRGGKLVAPHARWFHQTFSKAAKSLAERNGRGVGVFVTVNEMDGHGRSLENFKRVRAVYADMDADKCKTTTPKWPIKPSIVVASNGGRNRHFYWLHDQAEGEMDLPTFRGIGTCLIEKHGADKNAIDPVRVLRVPGFYHCKGVPAMVKLLECNGRVYTAAALVKAFPPIKRKAKKHTAVHDSTVDTEEVRAALDHLTGVPHPNAKHGETYADDYETWYRFGLAIKRGLGDDGFELRDEWARTSSRYPGEEASRAKWDRGFDVASRNGDAAVTVGTIFGCAKRHGFSLSAFRVRRTFERGLAALKAERRAA
jgi:hypothetical protein